MADSLMRTQVTGLKEVQAAFRQISGDLPKELRVAMKAIADHVTGKAQQKMPWITGEAMKSLVPHATQRGASIARPEGGAPWRGEKADYYPWLDFGGTTGRGHVVRKGGGSIIRPFMKGGRYLYPAIAESKDYIADEVDAAIRKTAQEAGFVTTGSATS